MICQKCKQPIENMTNYQHQKGIGDVHLACPSDPQQTLMGDDEAVRVDDDAQYPD